MVVNNKLINSLIRLGLTNYEAKTYCGLLLKNPATAYEAAKSSGVPSSKIYEVLTKLIEKEMIVEIAEEKKKYIPVDPDMVLEKFKDDTDNFLNYLSLSLHSLNKNNDETYIWNIKDYNFLITKANKIISETKKTLLVSIWKEEMTLLHKNLNDFSKKKKQLSVIHFGKPELTVEKMFSHPIEDTIYSEKGGRALVIVSDSGEVLWGNIGENNRVDGAYSKNKGFVILAEDYIKHDIYIMKIVKRFDKELIEKFGSNYKLLRDIFNDKEIL